jgi:hypothetical protein
MAERVRLHPCCTVPQRTGCVRDQHPGRVVPLRRGEVYHPGYRATHSGPPTASESYDGRVPLRRGDPARLTCKNTGGWDSAHPPVVTPARDGTRRDITGAKHRTHPCPACQLGFCTRLACWPAALRSCRQSAFGSLRRASRASRRSSQRSAVANRIKPQFFSTRQAVHFPC